MMPHIEGRLSAVTASTAMPREILRDRLPAFPTPLQKTCMVRVLLTRRMAHLPDAQSHSVQQGDIRKPLSSSDRMQPGASVKAELAQKPEHANSQPGSQGVQQLACNGVLQSSQENIGRSQTPSASGCCSTPPCQAHSLP